MFEELEKVNGKQLKLCYSSSFPNEEHNQVVYKNKYHYYLLFIYQKTHI